MVANHTEGGLWVSAHASTDIWQIKAACRGPQAAVFFPPPQFERKADRLERERRAKRICTECAVRQECLDYSLQIREPHGIWGGLNEAERRGMLEV
jgi:WhiB family redox-sensing transcriptional regulator